MNIGFNVEGILALLYAIQLFLCVMTLIAVWLKNFRGTVVLTAGLAAMSLFFSLIHFANKAVTAKESNAFDEKNTKKSDIQEKMKTSK